jgi:hypothetical protein
MSAPPTRRKNTQRLFAAEPEYRPNDKSDDDPENDPNHMLLLFVSNYLQGKLAEILIVFAGFGNVLSC